MRLSVRLLRKPSWPALSAVLTPHMTAAYAACVAEMDTDSVVAYDKLVARLKRAALESRPPNPYQIV
jgi:hypothetical protein